MELPYALQQVTFDQILFLLILGPGQYRFADFVRIGVPLTVVVALVCAWMTRWLWLGGPLLPTFGG